ncbi:acyl carrier protein [Lachnospiraceae bacterium 42-17]
MEVNKKMELLEDMLELDEGTLQAGDVLNEIEEWDSMAALSLIVLMDEEFGKEINGSDIKKLSTVQDILDLMD